MSSRSIPTPSDRWSLTAYFSAFGSADYHAFKTALKQDTAAALEDASSSLEQQFLRYEELSTRFGHISSFLGCLSSDDSSNEAVKLDEAWLEGLDADRSKLGSRLNAALAAFDDAAFQNFCRNPEIQTAAYTAGRFREAGLRQMSPENEALAADLNVDGLHAWGRLYETLTGKMKFPMRMADGSEKIIPMAQRRALMADVDRGVRLAAFKDGQQPWLEHEDTLAAALNGIAGTRFTVNKWRKIDHFLHSPLRSGGLGRATLDAMMQAIHGNIGIPRRIMKAAARIQGTTGLHFADLEAPQVAAPDATPIGWSEACNMVQRSFDSSYPALGDYFLTMLEKQWIEAQPRPAKRPGAFCTGSNHIREQRVYMTYHDTIHDVVTLAHEVGHAWHSHVLKDARTFASGYPMTLAETASNFGEMILLDGLKQEAGDSGPLKAYLLDQEMLRAHAYLVNIPMRYEFEKRFYEERQQGEVPVSRLKELMSQTQRDLYGDSLEDGGTDPMFWAYKMHFFITGVSFYNFPYVFGYLLSQALYARFKVEGAAFLPHYEKFLARTGSADCETVARESLGADLTDPAFWAQGILSLQEATGEYERLVVGS